MSRADDLAADARRRAHELMSKSKQQDAERLSQRDKQRQADAAKTARLKELRLAKEARRRRPTGGQRSNEAGASRQAQGACATGVTLVSGLGDA